MYRILLFALLGLVAVCCRNQKSTVDSTSVTRPEIPLVTVSPDQARVKVELIERIESGFQAKVIKQEEVGHSFQAILAPGQKIQLSTENQNISKGDVLICIVEKIGEDTFKLMNYK